MHIILGSVKLNLKSHTRKYKHTHIWNAPIGKEAYACVYIIELELKSIPIISTYYIYLQLWTWPQAYCTLFTTRVCKVSQLQIYYDNNLNHSPQIYILTAICTNDYQYVLFVQCNTIFVKIQILYIRFSIIKVLNHM